MGNDTRTITRGDDQNIARTTTRGTISQRSTLTEFNGSTGRSTFRGDSLAPHSSLGTTFATNSSGGWGYWGAYYGSNFRPRTTLSFGLYLGGGFSVGFSSGWYSGFHHNTYFGAFAAAVLIGHAWSIQPYNGCWGYYSGSSCYWLPYDCYSSHYSYYYNNHYCRVYRPYWLSNGSWYSWRPYSYGYTSLVYDNLYEDGYDDGYGGGYNRGYEDGAEDATGLRDDRGRDSLNRPAGPRPQPEIDRTKANASTEYRFEMDRGSEALRTGDYAAATKAFKEAAILDPNSADARYMLATSAMAQGKFAFAAFGLRRAISIDAEGSNLDLARLFGGPEAVKAQRDALQSALAKAPEDGDLLLLSGFVALRSGDARAAAGALDKALQGAPNDEAVKKLHKEAMDQLENG